MRGRSKGCYPTTRRLARELSRAQASARVRDYVSAVAIALRIAGATAVEFTVSDRSYLEARVRFRCAPRWIAAMGRTGLVASRQQLDGTDVADEGERDSRWAADVAEGEESGADWATLEWSEECGWSLTHSAFALDPSVWRFLPDALVPSPQQVVAFVAETMIDPDAVSRLPVRFRHNTQPVHVLTAELAQFTEAAPGTG